MHGHACQRDIHSIIPLWCFLFEKHAGRQLSHLFFNVKEILNAENSFDMILFIPHFPSSLYQVFLTMSMNIFYMSFENMFPFSFVFTLAAMVGFICMLSSYVLNHVRPLCTCIITIRANLHYASCHPLYPSVYLVYVTV